MQSLAWDLQPRFCGSVALGLAKGCVGAIPSVGLLIDMGTWKKPRDPSQHSALGSHHQSIGINTQRTLFFILILYWTVPCLSPPPESFPLACLYTQILQESEGKKRERFT